MTGGTATQGVESGIFAKTRLCKYHSVGLCSRGVSCTFAHGEDELQPQPKLFKSRICHDMARFGACSMGQAFESLRHQHSPQDCGFAHSREEIRRPIIPKRRIAPAVIAADRGIDVRASEAPLEVKCPVQAGPHYEEQETSPVQPIRERRKVLNQPLRPRQVPKLRPPPASQPPMQVEFQELGRSHFVTELEAHSPQSGQPQEPWWQQQQPEQQQHQSAYLPPGQALYPEGQGDWSPQKQQSQRKHKEQQQELRRSQQPPMQPQAQQQQRHRTSSCVQDGRRGQPKGGQRPDDEEGQMQLMREQIGILTQQLESLQRIMHIGARTGMTAEGAGSVSDKYKSSRSSTQDGAEVVLGPSAESASSEEFDAEDAVTQLGERMLRESSDIFIKQRGRNQEEQSVADLNARECVEEGNMSFDIVVRNSFVTFVPVTQAMVGPARANSTPPDGRRH